jgi:hypothetical protein
VTGAGFVAKSPKTLSEKPSAVRMRRHRSRAQEGVTVTPAGKSSRSRSSLSSLEDASPSRDAEPLEPLFQAWNAETSTLPRWTETPPALERLGRSALKRRPLEGPGGWREVFRLAQRSPVCRGEVFPGWCASLEWILGGPTATKEEPARRLLLRRMQVEPERAATEKLSAVAQEQREASSAAAEKARVHESTSEPGAVATWEAVRLSIAGEGRRYSLEWLERMPALRMEGTALVLGVPDAFFQGWVDDHYRQLMEQHMEAQGLTGVRYEVVEGLA